MKEKINAIVEQSYYKLKLSRRSYLELEMKYTEATQLLSLLIPQDVRKSQPSSSAMRETESLLKSGAKLAIKQGDEEHDETVCFERQLSQEELKIGELKADMTKSSKKTFNPWENQNK